MPTTSWSRIPAGTLADKVYHAVRARIIEGEIPPGEFLREKDLHEAMGVSRTPVREALGRLASEGFLERIPHRGFRVPDEPVGDLLELYPIVAALDLLAGRLALARLTDEDVAELRRINAQLRVVKDRKDVPALIDLNNRFHRLFSERSGNGRLCDLLDDLRTQLTRLEHWYYSDREHTETSISEHAEIIQAIEAGDHARALSLLEDNMFLTYRSLREETRTLEDNAAFLPRSTASQE
jgi:DNA-binding GntR family transcriptional regulator